MGKVITLKIMRTANGYYIEHEADKVINSYAVTCEADEWNALNPARANSFETLFTAKVETEEAAGDAAKAKAKIAELEKQLEESEKAKQELEAVNTALAEKEAALTALQEAAGELDIMRLIENAKAAAAETTAPTPNARNPELPLTDEKAAEPTAETVAAGEMSFTDTGKKETGRGRKNT
ncbi:MAG: hypothetical protein P1P65_00855 [Treponema sp.]